jgi:hypothetical protein
MGRCEKLILSSRICILVMYYLIANLLDSCYNKNSKSVFPVLFFSDVMPFTLVGRQNTDISEKRVSVFRVKNLSCKILSLFWFYCTNSTCPIIQTVRISFIYIHKLDIYYANSSYPKAGYPDWGFSLFSWDPSRECRDSTLNYPRPLPSKPFPIHNSLIILSFDTI